MASNNHAHNLLAILQDEVLFNIFGQVIIAECQRSLLQFTQGLLPHECLHLDYDFYAEFYNRGPEPFDDSILSAILSQLTCTSRLTCLPAPLQLTSKNNDAKQVHSDCMVTLQPLCSHLKCLDVTRSFCHMFKEDKTLLDTCANEAWDTIADNVSKDLVSLAVPPCFVLGDQSTRKGKKSNSTSNEMVGFGRRQREGQPTSKPSSSSWSDELLNRLERCVLSCPNLSSFDLMPWNYIQAAGTLYRRTSHDALISKCGICHLVKDEHLFSISKWTQLTSVTLACLPGIRHGKWLIDITKGCSRLRSLSLAYVGLNAGCVYMVALCEALKYAKNLQDLRVEQPNMLVNSALCRALVHCNVLTRLCLVTQRCKDEFSHPGILNVFQECKKLCVVDLITSCSKVACDRLSSELKMRYKKERSVLDILIRTGGDKFDKLESIPYVHISEMMLLRNHWCDKTVV